MSFPSATHHVVLVMGLTETPLLCVSPAAAQDVAASAVAGQPSSLPVLAEHRCRMLAKVRPLLLWISSDDVADGRITSHDRTGASLDELPIGRHHYPIDRLFTRGTRPWNRRVVRVGGVSDHFPLIATFDFSHEER